jgi:hypothetical protein
MRGVLPVAALVIALGAVDDLASQETPAESPRQREGIALVGIWEPTPVRVGVLIPLSDRWVLRPELGGDAWKVEGSTESWTLLTGASLMRRSAPTDAGFVYTAARLARYVDGYASGTRITGYQYALGAGGHAQLRPVLAVFAEAGVVAVYAEENDATTTIDRSIRIFTRFGFAARRPRRRD